MTKMSYNETVMAGSPILSSLVATCVKKTEANIGTFFK